jgi:hypothetical protein
MSNRQLYATDGRHVLTQCSVKLPKSFVAINLSEKVPDAFGGASEGVGSDDAGVSGGKLEESGLLAEKLVAEAEAEAQGDV